MADDMAENSGNLALVIKDSHESSCYVNIEIPVVLKFKPSVRHVVFLELYRNSVERPDFSDSFQGIRDGYLAYFSKRSSSGGKHENQKSSKKYFSQKIYTSFCIIMYDN